MSEAICPDRLARAVWLDVQRVASDTFRVSGGSADHLVAVVDGGLRCDCMDSQVRAFVCKHELCVRLCCGDADVVKALRELVAQPPRRLRRVA